MATYRPLKKILIPILALLIGLGMAYVLIPTKMDATWKEWNAKTIEWENHTFAVKSSYFRDGEPASEAFGAWSDTDSHYELSANVSDDTTFSFNVYLEDDNLYIYSGDEWRQGSTNDRFISEIAPLGQPFEWMRDMLAHAKTLQKSKTDNSVTYVAIFEAFDEVDFRGYSLEKQEDTTLTLTIDQDGSISMEFHALPIRPDYIGVFDGYPKELLYQIIFTPTDDPFNPLPAEAYKSKGLDE